MKCVSRDTKFQYSYTWEKQNEPLPLRLRAQGVFSSLLTITNLRTEDAGMYCCKISNFTKILASNFRMLTVRGDLRT